MICYLCGKELTGKEVLSSEEEKTLATTHGEHILHNAILGRLVSRSILCKKCGGSFSKDDDAPFTSLFAPFVSRLEECGAYPRRSTNSVAKTGYLHTSKDEITNEVVIEKDGLIFKKDNKSPEYSINDETQTVTVKASFTRTKTFKNQLVKSSPELATYSFLSEDYSSSGDHIAYWFSEQNPNFNDIFQKGIVKIAVEFALNCGVSREDIPLALTLQENGSSTVNYSDPQIVPYVPLPENQEECDYENKKHALGNYPYHMLSVFDVDNKIDNNRSLVCYINLFSTFQYYVILNRDYKGDTIHEYYGQRILRIKEGENELPPEFDVPSYLSKNGIDPHKFKRVTYDIETDSFMPTPYLCHGMYNELKEYVTFFTNESFKLFELFLWG